VIFWSNSLHAERFFKLQKRVIRLIKGCGYRDPRREHFGDVNTLPLKSLMMLIIKNREILIQIVIAMKLRLDKI
jgi:hypothetical protein